MKFLHEIRCALRSLRKHPLLSFVVVLALALGTGLTLAIFSVVNGWLLRPSPYGAASDRLVMIWENDLDNPQRLGYASDAVVDELRREDRLFERVAAVRSRGATPTALEIPSPLVREVTASYFSMLGIEPILGRGFLAGDDTSGSAKVVLLSHDFWQLHFGGDPQVPGTVLELDYEPYEIIGVMPADYHSPIQREPPQLWLPLVIDTAALDRRVRNHFVFARLAADVPLARVREEMARFSARWRELYPDTHTGREIAVENLQEVLVAPIRPALMMMFGAVAFVLLIACCNVANLLLARIMARERELAVRTVIGAGRGALLRLLLVENDLLALLGVAGGWLLAMWGLRALTAMVPPVPGAMWLEAVHLDGTVFVFALIVAFGIGAAFALVQSLQVFSRSSIRRSLSGAGTQRATVNPSRRILRGVLVVVEMAFSLVLAIGAGLMIQSFINTRDYEPGFDPARVLTLRTALRGPDYASEEQRNTFFNQAIERIRAEPGVVDAAVTSRPPPMLSVGTVNLMVEGRPAAAGFEPRALVLTATPGFFDTLSIPILDGRGFADHDDSGGEPVAIVNRALVERYWQGHGAVGERVRIEDGSVDFRKIVGVAGDVRTADNPPDPVPTLYLPYAQRPGGVVSYVVRTAADPQALARPVLRAVAALNPLMPIYRVMTLEETIAEIDWRPRVSMQLLSFFALLALFLAATGIYAVMAFNVGERTQEFGIRIALGAAAGDVLWAALKASAMLTVLGIIGGVAAALGLSRLLASQLYGVSGADPFTYIGLSLLLAMIALLASGAAARKAIRTDPATALRDG